MRMLCIGSSRSSANLLPYARFNDDASLISLAASNIVHLAGGCSGQSEMSCHISWLLSCVVP
jgi:hypothetical protein